MLKAIAALIVAVGPSSHQMVEKGYSGEFMLVLVVSSARRSMETLCNTALALVRLPVLRRLVVTAWADSVQTLL